MVQQEEEEEEEEQHFPLPDLLDAPQTKTFDMIASLLLTQNNNKILSVVTMSPSLSSFFLPPKI